MLVAAKVRLEPFMSISVVPRGRLVLLCGLVFGPLVGCKAEALDKKAGTVAPPAWVASANHNSQPARDSGPLPQGVLQLAGDLRPDAAADLAFKVSGQLLTVRVDRGKRVKKGQLLAALGETEARAQLAQAEAAVAQTQAQLALARDNEARAAALVAANAAPGSQAIAVRLQAETAQAALLQAQAVRDLAATALANHQLKAPFDGEIVRVPDGVGQIVAPGTVLFRLEALDRLRLRTTVSEADIDRIHVGDEVVIEANSGRKLVGKVTLVLRSLEASSRRAPIEVSVPNHDRALIAGSYVRATYHAHQEP
jgi:RND family efflux transporter MFP subunit